MSDKNTKQHKDFDRIFRENAVQVFLPLIEMQLGFSVKSYKDLPAELPKTSDRDVDALYEIIHEDGRKELLHIEFQSKNDPSMLERTAEYHGMIYRKYKLPIRHVVIFLGKGKASMKTQLPENEIFRGFDLINLHELDAEKLLRSQVPEVILLALLADFGKEQAEAVLRMLIQKLKTHSKSNNDLKKYLNQLQLLSKLRKLETVADEIIKDMPINYDGESHILYQRGLSKGLEKVAELEQRLEKFEQAFEQEREEAKRAEKEAKRAEKEAKRTNEEARINQIMAIKGFLNLDTVSKEQIADIFNVEIEYVEQIERGEIS